MMRKKKTIPNKTLLITNDAPFGYVESYKTLRTNLLFASVNKECKKIAVTSSIPGEGKSTVALNLAIALAGAGSKVLLIDCDLRKPVLHRHLKLGNNVSGGVTSVLAGMNKVDESTVYISDLGFYFIPSGPIPPNPAELLGSVKMGSVLNSAADQFDYVLLDTPPVSVVTDAAVLSQFVDGVLFVIRQNYTKIDTAKMAIQNLKNVGATVIGSVLNDFKVEHSNKSYRSYHYKKYAYK